MFKPKRAMARAPMRMLVANMAAATLMEAVNTAVVVVTVVAMAKKLKSRKRPAISEK